MMATWWPRKHPPTRSVPRARVPDGVPDGIDTTRPVTLYVDAAWNPLHVHLPDGMGRGDWYLLAFNLARAYAAEVLVALAEHERLESPLPCTGLPGHPAQRAPERAYQTEAARGDGD